MSKYVKNCYIFNCGTALKTHHLHINLNFPSQSKTHWSRQLYKQWNGHWTVQWLQTLVLACWPINWFPSLLYLYSNTTHVMAQLFLLQQLRTNIMFNRLFNLPWKCVLTPPVNMSFISFVDFYPLFNLMGGENFFIWKDE